MFWTDFRIVYKWGGWPEKKPFYYIEKKFFFLFWVKHQEPKFLTNCSLTQELIYIIKRFRTKEEAEVELKNKYGINHNVSIVQNRGERL